MLGLGLHLLHQPRAWTGAQALDILNFHRNHQLATRVETRIGSGSSAARAA
jgi:hypothetical protein